MIFQQITAKAQRLLAASVAVLAMASCAAAAAKYDTSIARDEWYGTTLQGMAARQYLRRGRGHPGKGGHREAERRNQGHRGPGTEAAEKNDWIIGEIEE